MDATKKPIKISPQLVNYAERHKLFENMKTLLELLILDRPADPISYLIEYLKKDIDEVPRVIVLGPPASGKHTVAKMLSGRLQCVLLTTESVFSDCDNDLSSIANDCFKTGKPVPDHVWVKALRFRTRMFDCEKRGWVLCGFPETREQVHAAQCDGFFPTHVVVLAAPDHVLVERARGKRIDPETGDVYHELFDPAPEGEVRERLVAAPGCTEAEMHAKLDCARRNAALVLPLYEHLTKEVAADQPLADVFQAALDACLRLPRLPALRTPRVVLLGPPGAGKATVAALLAKRYGLVALHCGTLVRQAVADGNRHGMAMRSYLDKGLPVPDAILVQLLAERLSDLCCSTYGWVLHGYPRTAHQAEELDCLGLQPNRIFVLEVPPFVSLERLCERRLDPVTGDRYHASYSPPVGAPSAQRLVAHPEDQVKAVKQRLARYVAEAGGLSDHYRDLVVLDANQDLHNVFELVESHLVNPLPRRLA